MHTSQWAKVHAASLRHNLNIQPFADRAEMPLFSLVDQFPYRSVPPLEKRAKLFALNYPTVFDGARKSLKRSIDRYRMVDLTRDIERA